MVGGPADGALPVRPVLDDHARAPGDASRTHPADSALGAGAASVREVPTCVDLDALAHERVACAPLACALSALACGRRHHRANHPPEFNGSINGLIPTLIDTSPCVRCTIGAHNARRAGL